MGSNILNPLLIVLIQLIIGLTTSIVFGLQEWILYGFYFLTALKIAVIVYAALYCKIKNIKL